MLGTATKQLPFTEPISNAEERHGKSDLESLKHFCPVEPLPQAGFYAKWGHQAWADLFIGKWALKKLSPVVPRTLVPIIKLCAPNRDDVTEAYQTILNLREKPAFTDSPSEKWRMAYGNFVRELEWACCELRKYFNKSAYEDLIINAVADYIKEALGPVVDSMNNMMVDGHKRLKGNDSKILKSIICFCMGFHITGVGIKSAIILMQKKVLGVFTQTITILLFSTIYVGLRTHRPGPILSRNIIYMF